MQYDNPVTSAALTESLSNAVSSSTLEAISSILKLDKGVTSVEMAAGTVTPTNGKVSFESVEGFDSKTSKVVSLDIAGAAGEAVTLDATKTKAKVIVLNSEADVTVDGLKGGHKVVVAGNGNDTLVLKGAKNTVEGGAGNDAITTKFGKDSLSGGEGNDSLNAGAGNDSISGGAGDDTLVGGAGKDTFIWTDVAVGEVDQVQDAKGSKLDLSGLKLGDAAVALKIGGAAVTENKTAVGGTLDANNNIAFVDGNLVVDLNGDNTADFTIDIVGTNTIKGVVYNAKTDTFDLV